MLFVLCLIIPFRRIRPLIAIVTSFTVAHSITLIGSAFGITPSVPWFPALIESLIAASIVYMALENIVGSRWERRWVVAFGFGLVHGFGFSFALGETLQFAGSHLVTSLLAFNIGVELGQILLIVIAVPLLNAAFRLGLPERAGTIIISALLAHSGWHWMTDRLAALGAYEFAWPAINAAFFGALMRWLMLFLIVALVAWVMYALYKRLMASALSHK
ncbi:MAG: HupE/UreJ family protein [Woeseiaceae bacterium]|nr:HupE/UreJ family protein [Woeseiaceae bacterium]